MGRGGGRGWGRGGVFLVGYVDAGRQGPGLAVEGCGGGGGVGFEWGWAVRLQ